LNDSLKKSVAAKLTALGEPQAELLFCSVAGLSCLAPARRAAWSNETNYAAQPRETACKGCCLNNRLAAPAGRLRH